MALIIRDVSYCYGAGTALAQPALADASLSLEPGELLLVLGPTGSGKSTLLRLAAGLLSPTAGSVSADGVDPARRSATKGRLPVGLAFQQPETQFFATTVESDVAFGPRNLGADADETRAAVTRALIAVGLDPETFCPRSPFTLSGGEARRAALAGLLALEPRYLLLDEPTSGLDATGRAAVLRSVAAVRSNTGVIVVTHDAEEFLPVATQVAILREGAVAFCGDVATLLAEAERLETAGLWTPPEVVRTQLLAIRAGRAAGVPTLDVESAAELLLAGVRSL